MGLTKKSFKGREYEILDHAPVPGYRTAFHIVIFAAVIYLLYIFSAN
jgi:hypothetical protein